MRWSLLQRSEAFFLMLLGLFAFASIVGLIWVFFPRLLTSQEARAFDAIKLHSNAKSSGRISCQWRRVQFFACVIIAGFSIAWMYFELNPKEHEDIDGAE